MTHTYIIAEVGNTHEGSLGLAKQFINAAHDCGADAVKIQTHIFSAESLPDAPNPPYFSGESRKVYFERTAFDLDQYRELIRFAETEAGIDFLSSAFSLEAVNLLEEAGIRAHKIPSGEVTNLPLLEAIAATRKPVFLSSGMSTWAELDDAVRVLTDNKSGPITVMQCASRYPCSPENSGLNSILEMKTRYPELQVGYSDHTDGPAIPLAAVTLGARTIEKHFTLSRSMYGSDARFSAEPDEFRRLVTGIRAIDTALTNPTDKDREAQSLREMKNIFEKSVVALADISAGEVITGEMIGARKPGTGFPINRIAEVLGRRATRDIPKHALLGEEDFS